MDEAKKTNTIRGEEFIKKYLCGKVIDIGAGKDLVTPTAESFDKKDGDANNITTYREPNSYDTVHSSHCLEHMFEPEKALIEWWKLVKPGGFLILVVPDEDLYEQGYWPSRFNRDHKVTFTLKKEKSWSPVSHNIFDLVSLLPSCEIISSETHSSNYDFNLQTKYDPLNYEKKIPFWFLFCKMTFKKLKLEKLRLGKAIMERFQNQIFLTHQIPIDQTGRRALAQIQVVARKL